MIDLETQLQKLESLYQISNNLIQEYGPRAVQLSLNIIDMQNKLCKLYDKPKEESKQLELELDFK